MKNLLYKEFKLSIHPLTYFFVGLMAMAALAPSFPSFVPLLYFGAAYTFLFIGMNKTTTTNDLLYTCMLPIKREDVVKARVFSTTFLQLYDLVLVFSFFAINTFVFQASGSQTPDELGIISLNLYQGIALLGVYLICLGVYDLIYMPWFYKNGKSIIANMLVAVLTIMVLGGILTILPYVFAKDILTIGHAKANYILQFGILLTGIGFWICSKVLVIKLSTKNLVKLDF